MRNFLRHPTEKQGRQGVASADRATAVARAIADAATTTITAATAIAFLNRTNKFAFAYLLSTKEADKVARRLLDLILIFGVPLSIRSDSGTQFTTEIVAHFYLPVA